MKRIGLVASEEKSFENVDDGRTDDDGRRIPVYTIISPMSPESPVRRCWGPSQTSEENPAQVQFWGHNGNMADESNV